MSSTQVTFIIPNKWQSYTNMHGIMSLIKITRFGLKKNLVEKTEELLEDPMIPFSCVGDLNSEVRESHLWSRCVGQPKCSLFQFSLALRSSQFSSSLIEPSLTRCCTG